ncbi:MAG: hypothetical protein ACRDRU_26285 [Pseudonocardiaceae bacterium]
MGESFATSAVGKILDASAVAAWASGHLGMQTWFSIAWELQLSFSLPTFARNEAMLLHPATEPLIETLARAPYVVLANLGTADAAAIDTTQQAAGVFDPLASWVVHACHQRGWPAVSTDPDRLRRIDPDLPIDVL